MSSFNVGIVVSALLTGAINTIGGDPIMTSGGIIIGCLLWAALRK